MEPYQLLGIYGETFCSGMLFYNTSVCVCVCVCVYVCVSSRMLRTADKSQSFLYQSRQVSNYSTDAASSLASCLASWS